MRLLGWRKILLSGLLSVASIAWTDCAIAEPAKPQASEAPDDETPARDPATVPVPPGSPGPADVAREIATACSEKRYSDVGALLHPSLRTVWIEIGYNVRDFCELITRNGTLQHVRVDNDERQGAYAIIYLTYTYRGGIEHADRSTFLPFKGVWKLAG
jgi:hypothetical protein